MIVISIKICDFVRNNNHYYNETTSNPPKIQSAIRANGRNIKLARKRRKLTAVQVSERAGIARSTLYLIEKGDASVSLGAYFNVLRVLGLQNDFLKLAADDEFGRKLQDLELLK